MIRPPALLTQASILAVLCLAAIRLSATTPVTCDAPATPHPQPTEYFVSLFSPATHMAHVSIRLREGSGGRTLEMPVWNALYQVRNFAANIENVRAQDAQGTPAQVVNSKTSEWQITAPAGCIVVSYDIHLNGSSPFGSVLNNDHAFLNWAMVLMYAPSLRSQPASIRLLDVPTTWEMRDLHVLGAARAWEVERAVGIAQNYDELADSPVEVSAFQQSEFRQDGATYHIAVHANPTDYDMSKLAGALERVTHAAVDWMHDRPYDNYTFIYHFPRGPAGGGMEHAYGAAIDLSTSYLRSDPLAYAAVSAHEFFHLWNVKRIRPQSLEPIDYEHEMDTRALWFSEGVTSTVADILLARSGLIDEDTYLMRLSGQIGDFERRPAHQWQSAEESSVDAWLEGNAFYRSPERSISYYNKGEILGVLLDLRIRQLTAGNKSLRDLFQWMNEHYAKQHRFFPDSAGVEEAAQAVTGQSFTEFFREYVAGVKPLPYDEFLRFAGLHLVQQTMQFGSAGFTTTANIGAQPEVTNVAPNSEAQRAGLAVGDRVVSIDGRPADAGLDESIEQMRPGSVVHLQVEGRAGKRQIDLKLGARDEDSYQLRDLPNLTLEQRAHRTAWIHGDDEAGSAH